MQHLQILPQELASRVVDTVKRYPDTATLFQDLINHIHTDSVETKGQTAPSKKRKLEVETSTTEQFDSIADISFSIPQRKKLKLEISRNVKIGAIRGTNNTTGEAEFGIPYADIDSCICLPVPEKAQPQYSFCVLPSSGDDQVLFTVPGTKIKPEAIDSEVSINPEESYKEAMIRILNKRLKRKVIEPDEKDFVSAMAQAHRKGEKAVHVKAFRGNKDGFLFFLPTGIIFAFKKPLLFYPFHTIASISYTSVLQRTFNLTITIYPSPTNTETHEIEFSMLDQADFAGIDAYIKRHGLQDASMAEQRRAQKYNVNGVKGEAGDAAHEGELEKAQREAEDVDDDEDEEDDGNFDPGSEGESEGSGSGESSEEDENPDNRADANGNLVEDESGSEADGGEDGFR
ncbi:MAG: hypothetical protein Q9200_001741 [Gallowayella weberi]